MAENNSVGGDRCEGDISDEGNADRSRLLNTFWRSVPLFRSFLGPKKAPESSTNNNSVEEAIITLPPAHDEALTEMKDRISTNGRGLSAASANGEMTSIFKDPVKFQEKEDVPQVVSIGPYYCGERRLDRMEQIKKQCLAYLMDKSNKDLDEYWKKVFGLKLEPRTYYSEPIGLSSPEFVGTMVLDGCFILQFFSFYFMSEENHPIAQIERKMLPKIFSDLLLLGNQIPFPVLEGLVEICGLQELQQGDFRILWGKVFLDTMGIECLSSDLSSVFSKDPKNDSGSKHRQPLHLLDMVRSCLVPCHLQERKGSRDFPRQSKLRLVPNTPSISKLRRLGMKVNLRGRDHFWEVEFQSGVIRMSKMVLNDLMCSFLVNCVAFEHYHNCPDKTISSYVVLLDCLVNTAEDVDYLRENGVLEHYKETDDDAAEFINGLGKTLAFDVIDPDIIRLCGDVNAYYEKMLHRQRSWLYPRWENFKREYFDKPWVWISVFVGLVLLILTCLQTYQAMRQPASST